MIVKKIKQPLILALISSINILSSFLLQIIAFNIIGVGNETDALFFALAIPTLILSVTVTSLNNLLVPLLSGKTDIEIKEITNSVFVILFGGSIFISLFSALTLDKWLPWLASGFDNETIALSLKLTYIQLISIPFAILYSIQWSLLNSKKKHLLSEVAPASISLCMFPVIVLSIKVYGIWGLAIATPIRMILQSIVLLPFTKVIGYKNFCKERSKKLVRKLLPLMLGSTYYKSEPVIDRSLLSTSDTGMLSLFYLCQQVYSALSQVIVKSFVTPSIARLGNLYNKKYYDDFVIEYVAIIKKLVLILIFVFIMYLLVGGNVIGMILGIKGENLKLVDITYQLAFLLFGSFVGNVLGTISSGVFYSIGNTKIPSLVSMVNYTVYIPFKIFIFYKYGVFGLALIISFYSVLNFSILSLIFYLMYLKKGRL